MTLQERLRDYSPENRQHVAHEAADALDAKDERIRQLDALVRDADELLGIAEWAISKLGLRGRGSDCSLSHEVRMYALHFSEECRNGPGELQVTGNGAFWQWRRKARAREALK